MSEIVIFSSAVMQVITQEDFNALILFTCTLTLIWCYILNFYWFYNLWVSWLLFVHEMNL